MERREIELRQLSAKLEATKKQLEAFKTKKNESFVLDDTAASRRGLDTEKRQLQADLAELETQYAQLDSIKKGLEKENHRLLLTIEDKEGEIQSLGDKCSNLGRGVSLLEDKCNNLSVTVDNLNVQLEKSVKNESDLHDKVADLSQSINVRDTLSHEKEEQVTELERKLDRVQVEKEALEEGRVGER